MSSGRDFVIGDQLAKFDGRFLRVEEVHYKYRKYTGELSDFETREVLHRGNAAAVLAFDRGLQQVVLVQQFRVATVLKDALGEGWLREIPAGVVDAPNETPRACARRELREETGYDLSSAEPDEDLKQLERFRHIATILPSPGGSSERIYIYYVEVGEQERKGPGGGNRAEGEDIKVESLPPQELFRMLDRGELQDAKLAIAAQWLRANPPMAEVIKVPGERKLIEYRWDGHKATPEEERCIVGIQVGNISDVHDVDIWVNSENTDMLMDRFFGTSVSATIRRLGAEKHRNGTIIRDTIAEELKARLGGQIFVKPGTVIVTHPGQLRRKPHHVRRIFHAAAVQALEGKGLYANVNVSVECLTAALLQGHAMNWNRILRPYASIVVPLLGTGQGGVRAHEVAGPLIDAALGFFEQHPDTRLRRVYLLAYTREHRELLRAELEKRTSVLKPVDGQPAASA
jgi:nudix-type nucleoside diphosphatase (YffH/AdpP family)